jgi:hypothetical protein
MDLISKFLQPYFQVIIGAAYNLQQSLEGLGLSGISYAVLDENGRITNSYWSLDQAIGPLLLGLSLFAIFLAIAFVFAFRSFGKLGSKVSVLVLILPGLFSVLGLWPTLQWAPRTYVLGSGALGSPMGMLAVLITAMSSGWTIVVLLSKRLGFDDRFRHGYDQFWYAMAVATGLFFVADLDSTQNREQIRESAATSQAASTYLLNQVRQLESDCDASLFKGKLACQWAKKSQWDLSQFAHYNASLYWQFGPENMDSLYALRDKSSSHADIDALRVELNQYNTSKCPVINLGDGFAKLAPISKTCEMIPAEFCTAYPERKLASLARQYTPTDTVAIANECVIPTLSVLKRSQIQMAEIEATNKKNRHIRWLFYIFFAFLAGGKVANATIRMFQSINQVRSQRVRASIDDSC